MIRTVCPLLKLADNGRDLGEVWYPRAEIELRIASGALAIEFDRLVDIVAILSPRVHVRRNLRAAFHYVSRGELPPSIVRSVRQSLANYELGRPIVGQKIASFARALRGDRDAITLDVWIARALRVDQTAFKRRAAIIAAGELFKRGAKRAGLSPREFQACVWVGAIRAAGRRASFFPVAEELALHVETGGAYRPGD